MTTKLGRNDPCHCGSDKKYKKCCLDSDSRQSTRTPEAPDTEADTGAMAFITDPRFEEKWRKGRGMGRSRRVVLKGPATPEPGTLKGWHDKACREMDGPHRQFPIVRLTDDGPDWGTEPGPDDEIGYGMHPYVGDDCIRCAVATCTQVGIEQVPDFKMQLRISRGENPQEVNQSSWQRLIAWAKPRGLEVELWHREPMEIVPRDRWIGVVQPGSRSAFFDGERFIPSDHPDAAAADHCLIMSQERPIFDVACSVIPPPGTERLEFTPEDITWGLSFATK